MAGRNIGECGREGEGGGGGGLGVSGPNLWGAAVDRVGKGGCAGIGILVVECEYDSRVG